MAFWIKWKSAWHIFYALNCVTVNELFEICNSIDDTYATEHDNGPGRMKALHWAHKKFSSANNATPTSSGWQHKAFLQWALKWDSVKHCRNHAGIPGGRKRHNAIKQWQLFCFFLDEKQISTSAEGRHYRLQQRPKEIKRFICKVSKCC